MSRIADNAIVFTGSCVLTLRCTRKMDVGGDPRRSRLYTFPLSFEGVSAHAAQQIVTEMAELGTKALNTVRRWEGRQPTLNAELHAAAAASTTENREP